jgi:transposase
MIDYQTYHQIRHLRQQGLTAGQIAGELKLDERTVRAWMDEDKYQPRHSSKRPSKLDAYRQEIIRSLQTHPFTARQILHRVKENGYTGGYSILKEFVASVRPPKQEAFLTLTFAPGECAQVDWGCAGSIPVGNTNRRLSFFVMVLCHSRRLFLEFTLTERLEQFLACHQNAFRYFGGVPEKVMVDNLKSAVLSHPFGQPAQYHPRYLDFAGHYGFEVKACNVRKPNEKGRVENAVAYVKKNFLSGLELKDFPAIQTAGRLWQDEVANRRVHAVTRRVPDEMFNEEKLQPLPTAGVYDAGVIKETMASAQFRVAYDGNRYSVPAEYAGHRVSLRAYSDRLAFYHDGKLIAEHLRSYQRGRDVLNPDHEKELLQQRVNIFSNCWKVKYAGGMTTGSFDASNRRIFRSSKPSTSSTGLGLRRSTAQKSKTCSASPFLMTTQMSSSSVVLDSERLIWQRHSATKRVRRDSPCSSPRLWTSSIH